ncbi:MAG: hypothetical protein CFE45_07710, partial [Burkholderiales bacterium PBB5]
QAQVDVLASGYNRPVFEWIPQVHQVLVRPEGLWARLTQIRQLRHRYDLVFQTLFDEHYLKRVLGARCLAGRGTLVGRARRTPLQHLMDHAVVLPTGSTPGKLLALMTPLGAPVAEALVQQHPALDLQLPEAPRQAARQLIEGLGLQPGRFVLLNLSAREAVRSLGDDQAIAIARGLLAAGRRVLVSTAPDERHRAEALTRAVPGAVSVAYASLAEAMATLSLAGLYVGPDTGSVHFAAAAKVPVVVLFGARVRADVWSPYGVPFIAIQANVGQTVPEIPVPPVLEAAADLLGGRRCTLVMRAPPANYPTPPRAAALSLASTATVRSA